LEAEPEGPQETQVKKETGRLSPIIDGRRKLEDDWKAWLEDRQVATVAGRDESGTEELAKGASWRLTRRLDRKEGRRRELEIDRKIC
jgi:hypothetical protein